MYAKFVATCISNAPSSTGSSNTGVTVAERYLSPNPVGPVRPVGPVIPVGPGGPPKGPVGPVSPV